MLFHCKVRESQPDYIKFVSRNILLTTIVERMELLESYTIILYGKIQDF